MSDPSALGANPLTLAASTLSDGTSLTLPGSSVVNFGLGSSNTVVAVSGSLGLNSTLNVAAGGGFGVGNYTLFTYTGGLSGNPVLGTTPPGYFYQLNTNTPNQVNLQVLTTAAATLGSPTISSNGQFGFSVVEVPGLRYAIQQSSNLVDWLPVLTNIAPFSVVDTNTPLAPRRFYRAVYLP
jgi:hypothetical protein